MSAKHTPGPWTAQKDKHAPKIVRILGADVLKISGRKFTRTVAFVDPSAVSDANAALIAAAPDLLEALEMMVRVNEDLLERHNHGINSDMARAAIAKARGE